ncbi:PilN domain-containing protein [Methylophilus sp.]|jgi:type IV pilus assembly protein PilN|uniref:PilN domain-containing protein n=1 Tax=Methylophilus sp. TaxID=29541 RepID=UPI0011D58169|nr:PilN domain-containing protein [Methylophilus sp.]TXI44264.1 MAG: fimbrial protein [Methylophilus sp.]
MIKVNLLPHRQIKRAERQREFGLMASLVAIAAAAILFVSWSYIHNKIQTQQARNQRLQDEMVRLDKEIAVIASLKEQIKHVLERKQIVEGLQSDRNQAVLILDELARKLPEGVFLKSVKQLQDEIELKGIADTNARIATLVHNLSESAIMHSPNLVEIKANTNALGIKEYEFVLRVSLQREAAKEDLSKQKPAPAKG